ncbi:MAG TPA: hypothetical protein VJP05_06390 [Acidimicrobiia bacterium]|nr:hypothetical protein [Acidimicrobiia bacterium]
MPSRLLGPIVRLQVQRGALKTPKVGYDPTPILFVHEAAIGPDGIAGRHEGGWVLDAHHRAHPGADGSGRRALSMGFSEHYERMAARFGSAPLGCAGENVIVATDRRIDLDDLTGTVVIRTADAAVPLTSAFVAAPCLEFTSFLLGRVGVGSVEEIGDDRAFLHDGTRGYILDVKHLERVHTVRVGDEVWVEG